MATKKQVKKVMAKAAETKETTEKKVEAKVAAEKVVAEKPVVEKAETKTAVKKTTKRTTKKDAKTTVFVEYAGKQVEEKDMIASVKKVWTKAGNKIGDIKSMTLYVKPEEAAVYYVINETETGKVEF